MRTGLGKCLLNIFKILKIECGHQNVCKIGKVILERYLGKIKLTERKYW